MVNNGNVAHQRRAMRVDQQSLLQILLGVQELFLLQMYHADAVPRVVVSTVQKDGLAEAGEALVHLFDQKVLVA